jgi:hypothetical protein
MDLVGLLHLQHTGASVFCFDSNMSTCLERRAPACPNTGRQSVQNVTVGRFRWRLSDSAP